MELEEIQTLLGVCFKSEQLLVEALTHPSMECAFSYERLEFLGDAVLDFVVASMLYELFPGDSEGELSNRQSGLVCRDTLAMLARQIHLGSCINFSNSEAASGGREKISNLENALEALIGAIFLDAGLEVASDFIKKHWYSLAIKSSPAQLNPKSALQEFLQAKGMKPPEYRVVSKSGPEHLPLFEIEVRINGEKEKATGRSKKIGEENAARTMLKRLMAGTQ